MADKQLVDSLTAHISLYNSHSLSQNSNLSSNPRSCILKWFSSLSLHQRQATLTTVDPSFVQLLLQMLAKLRTRGRGTFIILPDLPSGDLPSLCYRQSRGLLSRIAESNESERWIFDSVRLFGSREGENFDECSCSVGSLDSMTVSEEFVENVDRLVKTMDSVSNGAFLRGEGGELGSDWVELAWLKAKGYYSIEAFVANRLEVTLRLAWLNCNGGKKRGVKLKDKPSAAGVAANVYWRKKGCVEWWVNLEASTRKKVLTAILGKSARSLTHEILKALSSGSVDEMWLFSDGVKKSPMGINCTRLLRGNILTLPADAEFGLPVKTDSFFRKSTSLANVFGALFVLQDILSVLLSCQDNENDKGEMLFSKLCSVSTITDGILRKLREFLMIIALDCTKIELLGEENHKSSSDKSKEKLGNRKKKGKSRNMKRQTPVPKSDMDELRSKKPVKDPKYASACAEKTAPVQPKLSLLDRQHADDMWRETSSDVKMEQSQGLIVRKGQANGRKSRKDKNKNRTPQFGGPTKERKLENSVREASSCVTVKDDAAAPVGVREDLTAQGTSNGNLTCDNIVHSNVRPGRSADHIEDDSVDSRSCHINTRCYDCIEGSPENLSKSSEKEMSVCCIEGNIVPYIVPMPEFDVVSSSDIQSSLDESKADTESIFLDMPVGASEIKDEAAMNTEQDARTTYDAAPTSHLHCLSYEWPSVAPVYFPPINSQVPAAADRLHLDVGHNWHNHIRQPFVPTMHQVRNPPIEGGCSHILTRPVPMSLDWPPMVRSVCGLAPSITCSYDSGFISRRQSAFQQSYASQNFLFNTKNREDERRYSGDLIDFAELPNVLEPTDECDSHWISEEELEVHALSAKDYNQFFGGGIMYWNPSDHPGTGFSRPPSLSSDDSSWAWREADMSRAVDDMVAFSSSYSTNGLTSPTAVSFCSPFDLGPGHQAVGYAMPGNEVSGKLLHSPAATADVVTEEDVSGSPANLSGDVEGKTADPLPYPILRPIIIPNISRSRSDFKRAYDRKSPCVPPTRREQPRVKRPPSPVVLCVPRAPRPPPPSPVSDSRKQRGFPTVRSGSSSPRNWGVRGWYYDGSNSEEACVRMDGTEVVWPSWKHKNLSAHPMIQPLSGALLQDQLIAMSQLALDQEHPDISFPLQPPEQKSCPAKKASLSLMHNLLNDEIDFFCKRVAAGNMGRKPYINWAIKRVTRSLQVLWPRSRTTIYGSNATGLSLPTSDVDLVVSLPPVRNLEPIKEAGILEGRNGIKETCLQHAARYLANQEWVKNDSLKTVENTAIPIIKLVVEVPDDLITSASSSMQSPKDEQMHANGEHETHVCSDMVSLEDSDLPKCSQVNDNSRKDSKLVCLDISFKSPSHTGLQTTELVKELTEQFPAAIPLALVLKQFLADRSLDQSYSGGLSSYCLVLLITRFLQHEHHIGRPINQNFGGLLMDFLYFFGNVFDPRQMRVSVQGSGLYINRERGYSIDPIHIDDPLFPTNNVGRNCFRIHQCIKAFSDAYSVLENELTSQPSDGDSCPNIPYRMLPKIIPGINAYV